MEALLEPEADAVEFAARVTEMIQSCDANFFQEDWGEKDIMNRCMCMVSALKAFPLWTVSEAFGVWVGRQKRRPMPAEIADLARTFARRYRDELTDRLKAIRAEQEDREDAERLKNRVTKEQTRKIREDFDI